MPKYSRHADLPPEAPPKQKASPPSKPDVSRKPTSAPPAEKKTAPDKGVKDSNAK